MTISLAPLGDQVGVGDLVQSQTRSNTDDQAQNLDDLNIQVSSSETSDDEMPPLPSEKIDVNEGVKYCSLELGTNSIHNEDGHVLVEDGIDGGFPRTVASESL